MFYPEMNHKEIRPDFHALHWKLSDHLELVFNFYWEVVTGKEVPGAIKYLGEFSGVQPMFNIVVHPGLEQTSFLHPPSPAAVHKTLGDVPHFGDVVMCWHQGTVCETDGNVFRRVGTEVGEKVLEYHLKQRFFFFERETKLCGQTWSMQCKKSPKQSQATL